MLTAVVLLLVLAALAPILHRLLPRASSALLAGAPAGLCVWLATTWPAVVRGEGPASASEWVPGLTLTLAFRLDGLSLTFALLITLIGTLVLVYAGAYLKGDTRQGRFQAALLLFMAAMLGLVLADDALLLFVFWELTSVSSYLLIGYDHHKAEARACALRALLVTGLGGIALLLGLLLVAGIAGTYRLSELAGRGDVLTGSALYLPALLLVLLGAFTKSAQVPFHFWLPGAMAAPTPVSSYLHSATMVKAGIYLLARLDPALGGTSAWHSLLTFFGAVTMLVGATLALRQRDLKLVLAYTTVSGLGTLTLLIGIGTTQATKAALVFLLVHSLYKGALFMAAGVVDHETGTRDVEQLGGLRRAMPVTFAATLLAALSMAGLPPLFGFIAKELVYEAKLGAPQAAGLVTVFGLMSNVLIFAAAALVAVRPFFGREGRPPRPPHEAPAALLAGPVVLALVGLAVGLAPESTVGALVRAGVLAIRAEPTDLKLALWHGVNPVLGMSLLTVLGGSAAYLLRSQLSRALTPLRALTHLGPASLYERTLSALAVLAKGQTALLQSGRLRRYVQVTLVATGAAAAWPLLTRSESVALAAPVVPPPLEAAVALVVVAGAAVMLRTSSRLVAVAALGAVGAGVSLVFLRFAGPDLAMTQFSVEVLSVLLFVLVLRRLPRFASLSTPAVRMRDGLVAVAFGVLLCVLLLSVVARPAASELAPWYAAASVPQGKGRNVVNVILVDFRALDTLGEITVLSLAALGVVGLLRLRLEEEPG